jgi:hypothetical protein
MKHTIEHELEENNLGLNFEEKTFSWKVILHEVSDTDDDDDDCSSSPSDK